ncbi:hypothetical protein DACRYDRAFT_95988 [Dacryopinax primogenitus]|uniref:MOSC domain-containing protein n=1 Tax=Dacryopinax primogenitus (strain DJM 731) TaxID=1858805 RepID=M5G1H1_DACPD|nr:uncharacterized protein DACRYDRAFT_95988 [Dacryopinax primogenitus]EJT99676.1 hypothetical protein DACRYDRAFT_95988 [Dacryopinax primogenitus]
MLDVPARSQLVTSTSCHGTSVETALCTRAGLKHDREFMIIDAKTHKAITARDVAKMVLIHPSIHYDPKSYSGGVLRVSFPEESNLEEFEVPLQPSADEVKDWVLIDDVKLWSFTIDAYVCEALRPTESGLSPSEIISTYIGRPALLIVKGPSPRNALPTVSAPDLDATFMFQDGYPLMVLSTESIQDVSERISQAARSEDGWAVAGINLDKWGCNGLSQGEWKLVERFRPNIVFSGAKKAFDEDVWEEIAIHDSESDALKGRILLVCRCTRCLLPNVDPSSGIADKAVPFKVIAKYRRIDARDKYAPCVGVNAVPLLDSFVISVGDKVTITRRISRENETLVPK